MDPLPKFISYLIGYVSGSFTGAIITLFVYGGLFVLFVIPFLWIQNRFFPQLKDNQVAKLIGILISGFLFWFVIPWAFWFFFLKAIN